MTEALIMVMATFIFFHAAARLGHMPALMQAKWRTKFLMGSIFVEAAAAWAAFFESYYSFGSHYAISLVLFMIAAILMPLADPRLGRRHTKNKEVAA
jgi:hypothetical protein